MSIARPDKSAAPAERYVTIKLNMIFGTIPKVFRIGSDTSEKHNNHGRHLYPTLIHIVFAVKRHTLIPKDHKTELHQYITGIVTNRKQKMIQINSMPDHVHILVGITPDIALSDLVRDIKVSATKFINQKRWVRGQFKCQEGFGAFTYSHSQLGDVVTYIQNQEAHHSCRTFKEEYLELLKRFDVTYNEKYVFDSVDKDTS